MDSNKSNKISDIVKLQQILKKWKKLAKNSSKNKSNSIPSSSSSSHTTNKSISFLKRKLSIPDILAATSSHVDVVPKGFLAIDCVGKDEESVKRYVIPTDYLSHQAFGILLREAEEEFGFQQEGVLKIPCQVSEFENILKLVNRHKNNVNSSSLGTDRDGFSMDNEKGGKFEEDHSCTSQEMSMLGSVFHP